MRKGIFLCLFFNLFLTSCIHLSRSPQSGYIDNSISQSQPLNLTDPQIQKLMSENGLTPDDLNTPEGRIQFLDLIEIKNRETQLIDDREKRQYFQNLPWFHDNKEQLEFLRQNGYYARLQWLRKKGVGKRPVELDKNTEDLIANKDIALGMPSEFVRRSWGNPDSVDVAGNPIYGNQRWRYKKYAPSPEGYRLQSRIIYFESGKVAGWEQIDH